MRLLLHIFELHLKQSEVKLKHERKQVVLNFNRKEHTMKQTRLKNFLMIFVLIVVTGVAMAYSSN